MDGGFRRGDSAEGIGRHDGDEEDRAEHHDALDEVGPDHGEESANAGVENDDGAAEYKSPDIREPENRLEELSAGDEAGRSVYNEENQDEDGGDDAQHIAFVMVAVLQEIRQRQRVVRKLRVFPEPGGDELPVCQRAEPEAEGDPARVQAGDIGVARQAHQHPAAHVGRFGAHGDDPRTEFSAAQDIVGHVLRAPIEVDADEHHDGKVENKRERDRSVLQHRKCLLKINVRPIIQKTGGKGKGIGSEAKIWYNSCCGVQYESLKKYR